VWCPNRKDAMECVGCLKKSTGSHTCKMSGCGVVFCDSCCPESETCMVCACELQPVRDGFTADNADAVLKREANLRVVNAAEVLFPGQRIRALVLDSECGRTCDAFLTKFPDHRAEVVVTNPNEEVAMQLLRTARPGVTVKMQRIGTHLRRELADNQYDDQRYDVVWGDYCSTYSGSVTQGILPREDTRRIWAYGLRQDGRRKLVALTFCTREKKGVSLEGGELVAREQAQLAAAHGWRVGPVTCVPYGSMVLVIMEAHPTPKRKAPIEIAVVEATTEPPRRPTMTECPVRPEDPLAKKPCTEQPTPLLSASALRSLALDECELEAGESEDRHGLSVDQLPPRLPAPSPEEAAAFMDRHMRHGARLAVLYPNNKWYIGTVKGVYKASHQDVKTVCVHFDDGDILQQINLIARKPWHARQNPYLGLDDKGTWCVLA
jgi:hypothetical protein